LPVAGAVKQLHCFQEKPPRVVDHNMNLLRGGAQTWNEIAGGWRMAER